MRMLDLFCGRLGWANAFLAKGWECVVIDLVDPWDADEISDCKFIQANILDVYVDKRGFVVRIIGGERVLGFFDFVCASSPCTEFSTMRNFRPPVPHPEMGIKLFNHTRAICEESGVPYVMENVAGAGKWVGRAVSHCGSYYLWGSGVPPILPQGISKGMTELAMGLREHRGKVGWDNRHGKLGQTPTALVATIPPELANCVADYAERILEATCSAH